MASSRQLAARRNAQKSTGPRTASGKKRTRANALRHGLAAVTLRSHNHSAEIEQLAKAICADGAAPFQYQQALIIAESELELLRVWEAGAAIIERDSSNKITASNATEEQDKNQHAVTNRQQPELDASGPEPAPLSFPRRTQLHWPSAIRVFRLQPLTCERDREAEQREASWRVEVDIPYKACKQAIDVVACL
jgi:hypothetical protein